MGVAGAGPSPTRVRRWSRRRFLLLAIVLGVALLGGQTFLSSVPIPPVDVVRIVVHQATAGALLPTACEPSVSPTQCDTWTEIVWQSTVPGLVLALLVGAALGLSGATLQGTFRNPLADPYLLGISSGGTLGAAILFDFHVGLTEANLILPLFAFLGCLGTGGLILAASRWLGGSLETLLLVGVALGNILSALLSVVLLYDPQGSIQVSYWLLGGVGGASWARDGIVLGGLLVAAAPLLLYGRELNLLQLGPDAAQSLGVDPGRVRLRLLFLASLATAVAVAFAGIIGFVGLVAPHIVRRIASSDYRVVLPGAALVGAGILLFAHDLALFAFPHVVLPVGLFTAFTGAPFFFWLLLRHRRRTFMGGGA